jgi:hypothetical protein
MRDHGLEIAIPLDEGILVKHATGCFRFLLTLLCQPITFRLKPSPLTSDQLNYKHHLLAGKPLSADVRMARRGDRSACSKSRQGA